MKYLSKLSTIVLFIAFSSPVYSYTAKNKAFLQLKEDMWKMGVDFEYSPFGQEEFFKTTENEGEGMPHLLSEELQAVLDF